MVCGPFGDVGSVFFTGLSCVGGLLGLVSLVAIKLLGSLGAQYASMCKFTSLQNQYDCLITLCIFMMPTIYIYIFNYYSVVNYKIFSTNLYFLNK